MTTAQPLMTMQRRTAEEAPVDRRVQVALNGDIPGWPRLFVREAIARAVGQDSHHLVSAQVTVSRVAEPVHPYRVDIGADLDGALLHARADAASADQAVELAAGRLGEQISQRRAVRREHRRGRDVHAEFPWSRDPIWSRRAR